MPIERGGVVLNSDDSKKRVVFFSCFMSWIYLSCLFQPWCRMTRRTERRFSSTWTCTTCNSSSHHSTHWKSGGAKSQICSTTSVYNNVQLDLSVKNKNLQNWADIFLTGWDLTVAKLSRTPIPTVELFRYPVPKKTVETRTISNLYFLVYFMHIRFKNLKGFLNK